jgi:deoxyribodipyrimidine photolyase-like uncharacterized protein
MRSNPPRRRSASRCALPWLTLHPNTLFATDTAFYRRVFPKGGGRRLETFYRAARTATGLLMDGKVPVGGAWNYDAENRRVWKGDPPAPRSITFAPDAITREVMTLVSTHYPASLGSVDGFAWPVTADEAARVVDAFIDERLASFGPFEDAMAVGAPELFHSLLSAPLNLGLLDPLALCRRVEAAYRVGAVPLASAEDSSARCSAGASSCGTCEEHRAHYATANALAAACRCRRAGARRRACAVSTPRSRTCSRAATAITSRG